MCIKAGANWWRFRWVMAKPTAKLRTSSAKPSKAQRSRLAVYNTYIPQTGMWSFARVYWGKIEHLLQICSKFAQVCYDLRALLKQLENFSRILGGCGGGEAGANWWKFRWVMIKTNFQLFLLRKTFISRFQFGQIAQVIALIFHKKWSFYRGKLKIP